MAKKIDLDIDKVPWETIARVIIPIFAPVILAIAWVFLARTNKTVDWLSNVFALAELTPTVDLNLPSGVVLGSFYNSAEEIEPIIKKVDTLKDLIIDFVKDLKADKIKYEGSGLDKVVDFIFEVIKGGRF